MSSTATAPNNRAARLTVLALLALLIAVVSGFSRYFPSEPSASPAAYGWLEHGAAGAGLYQMPAAAKSSSIGDGPPHLALFAFEPIPLNRADAETLATLDGIGPVLAARIIAWREEHGPFRTVNDLLAVRGIGPKKLARLTPQLAVQ